MGNSLCCNYCSPKTKTHYCIQIEKLNSKSPAMWNDSQQELLKEYQDLFNIKFDMKFLSPKVETCLCHDCFDERFEPKEFWKCFEQEFERNGDKYLLSIEYSKKGFCKYDLP